MKFWLYLHKVSVFHYNERIRDCQSYMGLWVIVFLWKSCHTQPPHHWLAVSVFQQPELWHFQHLYICIKITSLLITYPTYILWVLHSFYSAKRGEVVFLKFDEFFIQICIFAELTIKTFLAINSIIIELQNPTIWQINVLT